MLPLFAPNRASGLRFSSWNHCLSNLFKSLCKQPLQITVCLHSPQPPLGITPTLICVLFHVGPLKKWKYAVVSFFFALQPLAPQQKMALFYSSPLKFQESPGTSSKRAPKTPISRLGPGAERGHRGAGALAEPPWP